MRLDQSGGHLFQQIPNENPLGWNFCNLLLSHKAIAGLDLIRLLLHDRLSREPHESRNG